MRGQLILVLGGARSGKSELAEKIALKMGGPVKYIATATIKDQEMAERVKLHRSRRPASWLTFEEPTNVLEILKNGQRGDIFLLDCLTMWQTNLLLDGNLPNYGATIAEKQDYILKQAKAVAETVSAGHHLIIVSSEVGLGLIPEYQRGRAFRDLSGLVNRELAAKADHVYFTIAGLPLEIKSLARHNWSN